MIEKLNPRERVMLGVVVAIITLLLASMLISGFRRSYSELTAEAQTRREELESVRAVLKESDLWEEREIWLATHQPRLESREQAGVDLLEEVRKVAAASKVQLERPEIGAARSGAPYEAAVISVQTRSDWPSLIAFLHQLQQPEQFVVFEEVNLRLDAANDSQMIGSFKIAKWYAAGQ